MIKQGAIKFYSQLTPYRGPSHRDVAIFIKHPNGDESMAEPLVFKDVDPSAFIDKPTIGPMIGVEFLQAALDHAWEIGLRPAGFSDTPLQVEAIKAHLADMRALVFSQSWPDMTSAKMPGRDNG